MDHRIERSEEHPDIITINMGPSHPATHGVLRIVLQLDGETVVRAVPHVGYLHRGMEKLGENRTYLQFIPYTDRMDYLSPLCANVGFTLAVEELLGVRVPPRCEVIRVLACELARIGSRVAIRDLREALADPELPVEAEMLSAVELIGKKEEIHALVRAHGREDAAMKRRIADVIRTIMRRERIRRNSRMFREFGREQLRSLREILPPLAPR